MQAFLIGAGCGEVLDYDSDVPKDDEVWSDEEKKKPEVRLAMKVQRQNKKAHLTLLTNISDKTEADKEICHMVEKHMNKVKGYAAGNFQGALRDLDRRFLRKKKMDTKSKIQSKYYSYEMKADARPGIFIMKREQWWKRLINDYGMNISEEEFVQDALNRLPKSDDPDNLGPYQQKKEFIDQKIAKDPSQFGIMELTDALQEVYDALNPDEDDGDSDDDSDSEDGNVGKPKPTKKPTGETLMAAYGKSTKSLCSYCGKQGHKAADCWEKNGGKRTNKHKAGRGNKSRGGGPKGKFAGWCFCCKKKGHCKSECRKLKQDK